MRESANYVLKNLSNGEELADGSIKLIPINSSSGAAVAIFDMTGTNVFAIEFDISYEGDYIPDNTNYFQWGNCNANAIAPNVMTTGSNRNSYADITKKYVHAVHTISGLASGYFYIGARMDSSALGKASLILKNIRYIYSTHT